MNQATTARVNNVCLIIIASFCVGLTLSYTRSVAVPFVFSIFIHAIFAPGVKYLQDRLEVRRWISLLIAIGLFLLISSGVTFFLIASIQDFFQGASIYREKVLEFVAWGSGLATKLGFDLHTGSLEAALKSLPILDWTKELTGGFFGFLGNASLVIIFVLFLMAGEGSPQTKSNPLLSEIQLKVSRYVSVKFSTSLATGLVVGIVLSVLGVELAFMLGVLTFLLNFIPSIGSIIATILPLPLIILQYAFGWQFAAFLVFAGGAQFFIGNILEPKLMGENMDLHPVTVLVFLVLWGLLWGVPGMFLAVPITAILKIILDRIEATRPLAEILAGRIPS